MLLGGPGTAQASRWAALAVLPSPVQPGGRHPAEALSAFRRPRPEPPAALTLLTPRCDPDTRVTEQEPILKTGRKGQAEAEPAT